MVFGIFKKKKKAVEDYLNDKNVLELTLNESKDCILDFTYNFIWQSNFDIKSEVFNGISYEKLVNHIKNPENVVYIKGDVD